ncbi:ABC transporter ATP-binding protein [Roseivirga sp. E12]|uniref:ABC transporter ATP-binding protein n=1 Tax=Roseivirga sp. E12 TaxID=2819237 RepID=UPI001ABC60F7|nr:ABC transporter ATP-binding protein [Roseivirga sp. E12]MBO3699687.1 ABC transporter ATP-binding protein [Roseivirga sp. E12]
MGNGKTILRAIDLAVGYKEKEVLSGLNLVLNEGELTCLLGPNGSGKSTLIRSITGIQKPLSGKVLIQERSLSEITPKEMAKTLSLVLTDRVTPGNLTVFALVSLGRFPYTSWMGSLNGKDKELIQWALEVTGTLHFADRHVGELSDGEKQKVMIARALVQDTDIIILDEPTAHLDSPNRIEIFHLLKELTQKTNKTILISTHEIDMAIENCDSMWLVMPGKHIETGIPEELVLNGSLESAFGSEELTFDYLKGRFGKSDEHTNLSLEIAGDPILTKWTRQALERSQVSNNEEIKIEITGGRDAPLWHISGTDKTFNSLSQLINYLKQNDEN